MSSPLTFGEWFKSRRKALDLTQNALAERANCSVFAVRKVEAGERRPSKQLAEIRVTSLEIPFDHQNTFIKVARGEWSIKRLTALEWAFSAGAPSERVDQGFCLINSIGRFWEARGHIQEGITWLECGLQVSQTASLARARALRMIGLLYNHGEDEQTPVRLLQESLALARQLNDEVCQANALDTLVDVAWRFGHFQNAKACYAESLELLRKIGDPRSIGLSLASAGRLHVDYGYYPEAEQLACEGLFLLDRVSDLRGIAFCLNVLGRVALLQGDVELAVSQFKQALRINYELRYMVDIFENLHEIAVVKAISGDQNRATLLLAAASALNKTIGIVNLTDERVDQRAPVGWLQAASGSNEWSQGLLLSLDQAVAYALDEETL